MENLFTMILNEWNQADILYSKFYLKANVAVN